MAKASDYHKAYMREYYRANRKKADARMAEWRHRKRLEFIEELGGKCEGCGVSDPVVLDFDHIRDDGADHRRATGRMEMVRYFSKHGVDSSRFQLLCKNCNWVKEYKRRKNAKRKQEAA